MQKVPFTNDSTHHMHVGGVLIPPGETRDVDPRLIEQPVAKKADPSVKDPLEIILDGTVDKIVAGLEALSDEELHRLEELEAQGRNRKGVLAGIAEDLLRRAAEVKAKDDQSGKGAEGAVQ